MITDAFTETTTKQPIFELIYLLLCYGKSPEKCKNYAQHKSLLAHVENFISYHLNNKSDEKVHAFVCFESSNDVRQIITEYLVLRFGALHKSYISKIHKEVELSKTYGWRVPEQNGSKEAKQYFKNINFITSRSRNGKMKYGDALRSFKILLDKITNSIHIPHTDKNSMIVCMENDLPDNRDSLLPEFYTTSFNQEAPLYCNFTHTGESLVVTLIDSTSESESETNDVNAFLIYSNTDQAKLHRDDLATLEQCDYNINNYFVFYFKKRNFCARNLKTILQQVNIRYTKDVFFFDREELDYIFETPKCIQHKEYIGSEEDANLYGMELQEILAGIPFAYNYRNILSLCRNDRCKKIFFDSILRDTPEYSIPDSGEIFLAIQEWWIDKILPKIRSFALDSPIAFIVDWKTPQGILDEIKARIGGRVVFYDTSALKIKKGENTIRENVIISMRHIGFDEFYTMYPNSHEHIQLNKNQRLLEIIPLALFAPKVLSAENKLIQFYNRVKNNTYRKDCFNWKPVPKLKRSESFLFDWDEIDEASDRDHKINRVKISLCNDKEWIKPESNFIIYFTEDKSYGIARICDIYERDDISAIALIDNIEHHLGVLIEEVQSKYEAVENTYRKELENSNAIEQNPEIEIWRLLLKKKVEVEGLQKVTQELGKLLERYEDNHQRMIERWLDLSQQMILPRRNYTWYTIFDYLGIAKSSPYRTVIRIKKINAKKNSSEKNKLIQQLMINCINSPKENRNYEYLYKIIPDSLDVLGIHNDEDFTFIWNEVLSKINIVEVKNISIYE